MLSSGPDRREGIVSQLVRLAPLDAPDDRLEPEGYGAILCFATMSISAESAGISDMIDLGDLIAAHG